MNRNALMEYLKRNGWEKLCIVHITEYSNCVSVIGHHGNTCVSLEVKKRDLNRFDPTFKKEECDGHD